MSNETTVILCGGSINYANLPISTNLSNAMVPVNGKPVIGWILDDLLAKGIRQAVIARREQDQRLQAFVRQAYSGRMDVSTVPLHDGGSIVDSLQAGLLRNPTEGLVRIVLGDTLIRDTFRDPSDFVYVGAIEDSRRWCLAVTTDDGLIIDYVDKQGMSSGLMLALAGYYHLQHGDHLRRCVGESLAAGERELSNVLRRYGHVYPIQAHRVREWYDFGHIDKLVDARRRLLQPRYFNSLTINPVLNTITKVSQYDEKLRDELNWFLSIPDDLQALVPRILKHQQVNGQLHIVQEYYGYPTLAELYVYGDFHAETWFSILRLALRIHQEFKRYPGKLDPELIESIYINKTWNRLDALRQKDPCWDSLLSRESVTFNSHRLRNIYALEKPIYERARSLAKTAPVSVIHGDFCFSNILFDVNNQIIRLIDPRGSFGRKGIYGDSRYDIAKLRHSVCGLYDYIVADMLEIQEMDGDFTGDVFVNGTPRFVGAEFDRIVSGMDYNPDDIRFIEGLLFISMLPLHHGHPQRQRMMYLRGLSLLNEVL